MRPRVDREDGVKFGRKDQASTYPLLEGGDYYGDVEISSWSHGATYASVLPGDNIIIIGR